MRLRFFALTTIVIFATTVFVNIIYTSYIREDRLNLIDSQLKRYASALAVMDLPTLKKIEQDRADTFIAEELGPSPYESFYVIKNNAGEVIFENARASKIARKLPQTPHWISRKGNRYFIRAVNVSLPKIPDRTLQVGLIFDRQFMDWTSINKANAGYITIISLIVVFVSFFLTYLLLNPFRQLVTHIKGVNADLQGLKDVKALPESMLKKTRRGWFKSDEFTQLTQALQGMIDRINNNNRITRVWSARMAHEFKTPLAILRANLETGKNNENQSNTSSLREIEHLTNVVNEFLSWAELETAQKKGDLHALKMAEMVQGVADKLDFIGSEKIRITQKSNFTVVMSPTHFDQLFTNLMVNAAKFSPPEKRVDVVVDDYMVEIIDSGDGIPADVLNRMGEPFNFSHRSTHHRRDSTGLGLAVVNSLTRLYEIKTEYKRMDDRSVWQLRFNPPN